MKSPNGPKTPALVQLMQWIADPFAFMHNCQERYGDCFTARVGGNFRPQVFVSNPQAIEEILTGDTKQFEASGDVNEIFQPLLGEHAVTMMSGVRHRRHRQLMMPPFHGERMRTYGEIISHITEQVMSEWKMGLPFKVRHSMQTISLRVILRAVFGLNEGSRYQQMELLVGSMLDVTASPLSASMLFFPILQKDLGAWSPWGRFLRQKQQIDSLIYAEIQERREQGDTNVLKSWGRGECDSPPLLPPLSARTDILSLLMSARDEAGAALTDVELHDELMTLLLGGHETTATAITWALYWIHKLPEVREKLVKELDSLGEKPDNNAIFKLPYLNAVCSETLRIYPVGMLTFPRVVRSPVQLLDYDLEPGTTLVGCIYLIHQREDVYPQPKQFKPERFLERQFSPYEYIPFGGGSRRCIGMAFALFEMKVVLAKILANFELAPAGKRSVKPIRRGLVSAPTNVRLVVTGKRQKTAKSLATQAL